MNSMKLLLTVVAAAMVPFGLKAAPASPMKVKMAAFFVTSAEKGGGMAKSNMRDARQRVDELLASYASDPAVIDLDTRLKKVEEAIAAAERERAAAEKAKAEKLAAEKKAEEEAAAAKKAALAHKAPLPWLMEKEDRDAIAKYVDSLGRLANEKEADDLKAALEARAAEDRKIVEAKGEELMKAQDELSRYNLFLDQLGHLTLVGFFEGKVDLKANKVDFKELRIRTSNSSVYVRVSAKDDKEYFYEMNGARCYVEGDDLAAVNEARRRFFYVNRFLKDQTDEDCRRDAASALLSLNLIDKAVANNSPDNIEFAPMPKKGALHAEFAKEALATITTEADNYKDVYEVVIDANNWQMETKLGNVVRRKFGGWWFKKLKYGIRAFRVQWCQDHMGGGKYGKLRLYATAGGSMYVK